MTTYTPSVVDRKYGPRGDSSHAVVEVLDVYYPDTERWVKPAAGWSFCVLHQNSGFTVSTKPSEITAANTVPHDLLERGIAVVIACLPVARGGASPNPESGGDYGAAYTGNGVTVPTSGNPGPGGLPPGFSGTHPWSNDDWLMLEKSALDVIQHLRHNAVLLELNPDEDAAAAFGTSGGAIAAMFAVFGPDRIDPASATLQKRQSTRYGTAVLNQGPAYFPTFDQETITGVHFSLKNPDTSSPFDPWDWDEPGTFLINAHPQYQLIASPYSYGRDEGNWPGITALNQAGNVLLEYVDAMSAAVEATVNRYTTPPTDLETEIHSAYGGYLLKAKFTTGITLMLSSDALRDETAASNGGVAEDLIIEDAEDRHLIKINHIVAGVGGSPSAASTLVTHYADVEDDVLPLIKRLGQDVGSSYPLMTTAEVTQVLVSVEGQVDSALSAGGAAVPVTEPNYLVNDLRLICAWGTAWQVVLSYMLHQPSPALQVVADIYREQYLDALEGLRDGSRLPATTPQSGEAGQIASHLMDYPDADPIVGTNARSAIVRGKDW